MNENTLILLMVALFLAFLGFFVYRISVSAKHTDSTIDIEAWQTVHDAINMLNDHERRIVELERMPAPKRKEKK